MTQILHTKEIGNEIQSLIWTNLKTSLGLVGCNLGDISFYESSEELTSVIPGVFINPVATAVAIRTMKLHYTVTYTYRIIFVDTFDVADNVVDDKIDAVNSIAELLFNNTGLTDLTLSNAKIEKMVVTNMDYLPNEEGFLTLLGGNYVAAVVEAKVTVHTTAP